MTINFSNTIQIGMKPGIAVVLVAPQGEVNIGAAARAMKNYGLRDLRLVDPVSPFIDRAYTWAVGARDLLDEARIFPHIDQALGDVSSSVAFTRRTGRMRRPPMSLKQAAPWIASRAKEGGIALVFGREDKGLTNAEIKRTDALVTIPSCEDLPSLNLAQAVLIACYEVSRHLDDQPTPTPPPSHGEGHISRAEMAGVLDLIKEALDTLGYKKSGKGALRPKILHRIERIFGRAGLTQRDKAMIEGLMARIIQKDGKK